MKKTICVILTFVVIFTSLSLSGFAREKCDCSYAPVIFVVGLGEELYLNEGMADEVKVPDISGNILKMIPKLVLGIIMQSIKGDYKVLGSMILSMTKDLAEVLACDKDGNSKYNVTIRQEQFDTSGKHEALKYGEENPMPIIPCDYKFKYDWRLDPLYNAELLYDYIEQVKSCTGHDKVIIMAHSEGNNVLCSYLNKYGSDNFEKVMFLSPAYRGLSILGSLFAGEYLIGNKSKDLVTFLDTFLPNTSLNESIKSAVSLLERFGLVKLVLKDAQNLLDNVYEQKIYDYLIDVLGTMPGMWSFCPDEYYERAKQRAFDGKEGYDNLIERIDYYHYNVQKKVPEIIQNLLDKDIVVYIVSGYGISSIPVSNSAPQHSDVVIDTKYMSLGATCSKIGKTFDDGYVQSIADGHDHVSPDMMVDASTCMFPEITWFIRDISHDDHPAEYCQFLWALAYGKRQLDVFSLEGYSQFMKYENGHFVKVDSLESTNDDSDFLRLFKSLFSLIKGNS